MYSENFYVLLADVVLCVHFLVVAFIVLGFAAILVGHWRRWAWVHNPVFRNTHLLAICVVVLQSWFGKLCALTTLESALRAKAGQAIYSETFIQHWLHRLLFFDAQIWVFTALYSIFGGLIFLVWISDRSRNK